MTPLPTGRIRPGGLTTTGPSAALGALKALVRAELHLGADDVVLVSELRCAEAGCPPVETVVVVLDTNGHRKWQLPLPPEQVTPTTLRQILATDPEGQTPTDD